MNKRLFFVFGFIISLNTYVLAQQKGCSAPLVIQTAIERETQVTDDQEHPYGGTFQLICSKSAGKQEIFTTDLLKIVEDNRLENKENIIVLSPITRLRILSKEQIASQNFQPIAKLYSFE